MDWIVLTEDERRQHDLDNAPYWAARAEHEARVKACGDHDWVLDLEHPDGDDTARANLSCLRCHADCDDLIPDGHEMMFLFIDDVEIVSEGYHSLPYAARVPVTVDVWSAHYSSPNGEEWDVEIRIEAKGPLEVILEDEQ